MANKLSLNVDKTKYSLFHERNIADDLPLKLPTLSINDQEENSILYKISFRWKSFMQGTFRIHWK